MPKENLKLLSDLPLGAQLQIVFTISSLILCTFLFILAKYELEWFRNIIIQNTYQTIESSIIAQVSYLGEMQTLALLSNFQSLINQGIHANKLTNLIIGYSDQISPLVNNTPYWHTEFQYTTLNYSYPSYMSAFGEKDVHDMMIKISPMDKIYSKIFSSSIRYLYEGYYEQQLLHIYPGYKILDSKYNPLVREWFYQVNTSVNGIYFTEPYVTTNGKKWVVGISQPIFSESNKFIGVSGIDVLLETLKDKVLKMKILNSGFVILVSVKGMIVTMPERWLSSSITLSMKIYNTTCTGITISQWEEIKKLEEGGVYNFVDAFDSEFLMIKYTLSPLKKESYYLLLCIDKSEINTAVKNIDGHIKKSYVIAYWISFCVSLTSFLFTTILIYVVRRKIQGLLKAIMRKLKKLLIYGIYPNPLVQVSFKKLYKGEKIKHNLAYYCNKRIRAFYDIEEKYSRHWNKTRPGDTHLFNDWEKKLYPINAYLNTNLPWKHFLEMKFSKNTRKFGNFNYFYANHVLL